MAKTLEFVSRSEIFEITDYSMVVKLGTGNCILSERFTVGGYDWVIQFYPLGSDSSVSDYVSVYVKALNKTNDSQAMVSFSLWDWKDSKWSNTSKSVSLFTIAPSGRRGTPKFIKRSDLEGLNYMKNDTLQIKSTLFVTPDSDKTAGDPSGANISIGNGFHTVSYAPPNIPRNIYTKLPRQPTVRIYCKANNELSLTVRNNTVVLAPANSNDHYQHWIKDMTYGDKVKDEWGYPVLALVNSVTGDALKNPAGENHEVRLIPYNKNCLDDSVKWAEVWSTGFRVIRIADTTSLNLTAVGSDNDTNFSDGAKIVVKKWVNTPFQHWNIVPYNSNVPS